jgi:hypothetical protein
MKADRQGAQITLSAIAQEYMVISSGEKAKCGYLLAGWIVEISGLGIAVQRQPYKETIELFCCRICTYE